MNRFITSKGISPADWSTLPDCTCTFITLLAISKSRLKSRISRTMKIRSNRERMEGKKSMFSMVERVSSYRPYTGFAAANTEQRLFNTVVIPAFAIEMVCCSIA